MKKHETIPNEPEEAPVMPEKPGVNQPSDPKEPQIPQELPPQQPQEVPPGETTRPEFTPGKNE
jgi:hypothetical protein